MKIAVAQLNYKIGDFASNKEKIFEAISKAEAQGANLVVFSELSVCGSFPFDLLKRSDFLAQCKATLDEIAARCTNIAAIVGAPMQSGDELYNAAYLLCNGKIDDCVFKMNVSDNNAISEQHYFTTNKLWETFEIGKERVAVLLGNDVIYSNNDTLIDTITKSKAAAVINIVAVPFAFNREVTNEAKTAAGALVFGTPTIFVNQVGANAELIYDGGSCMANVEGKVIMRMAQFAEDFAIVDTSEIEQTKELEPIETDDIAQIHDALILGIKDYFAKTGFKTATLGLSGGIDSAVVVSLAVEALGKENVRVLLMPSKYSSDHSVNDATALAQNLQIQYDTVAIQPIVDAFGASLADVFAGTQPNVTEENLQARVRGTLVMAMSNKFGNLLLNTSNKSEAAAGYGTLYGDLCGGLSILGDVYKTDVFKLARYINRNGEIIPENTITKAPSAELRPGQKDSDSLPDYSILDAILFRYIELGKTAEQIIADGFDASTVEKTIRLLNSNDYKRFQCPPILRVTTKAFGAEWHMPLVAVK